MLKGTIAEQQPWEGKGEVNTELTIICLKHVHSDVCPLLVFLDKSIYNQHIQNTFNQTLDNYFEWLNICIIYKLFTVINRILNSSKTKKKHFTKGCEFFKDNLITLYYLKLNSKYKK